MAGKKGKLNNKKYGSIKVKDNDKYLVTFDFGMVNGKRVRQSRQYNDPNEAKAALDKHAKLRRQNKNVVPSNRDNIGFVIKQADEYAPIDLAGEIINLKIPIRPFSYWGKHQIKKDMFKEIFNSLSHMNGPFRVIAEFGFGGKHSMTKWKISCPDVDNCARGALSHLDSNKLVSLKMRKINTLEDYIHIVLAKPENTDLGKQDERAL